MPRKPADTADTSETAGGAITGPSPHLRPPWKPGESGNPSGRPKGVSLTATIMRLLSDDDAERIIRSLIQRAGADDVALRQLIERTDGKVTDKIEHSGELTLSFEAIAAAKARAAAGDS